MVTSFFPIYNSIRTNGYCQIVEETVQGSNGIAGNIIGGVAGGIVGHQVGKGSGRDIATALGAVVGAVSGGNIERNMPQRVQRQVCEPDRYTQQFMGYHVEYDYRGLRGSVNMSREPGQYIPVQVTVTPMVN